MSIFTRDLLWYHVQVLVTYENRAVLVLNAVDFLRLWITMRYAIAILDRISEIFVTTCHYAL